MDARLRAGMAKLNLRNDQRVGAIGRTRCGKTFLMRQLLQQQPRVLVIDDKQRVNFPRFHLTYDPKAALLEPRTILRPEGKLPSAFWEEALWAMNEAGGGIIYVDELSEQCGPNSMPAGMRSIFRMGGELGVGFYWCAQSATEITNTAIRQSDVLLLFLNIGSSDRDKVIKIVGDLGEVTAHLPLYEFVVYESAEQGYDPSAIPSYRYEPTARELTAAK